MKSGKILAYSFLGLVAVFFHTSVFAEDELYLCGIVKEVNTKNAVVIVDVKSKSCRGLHTFNLSDAKLMEYFIVEENRCFFIDSNQCQAGYKYNITKLDDLQLKAGEAVLPAERADKGPQSR
jgi:hypothetical protein